MKKLFLSLVIGLSALFADPSQITTPEYHSHRADARSFLEANNFKADKFVYLRINVKDMDKMVAFIEGRETSDELAWKLYAYELKEIQMKEFPDLYAETRIRRAQAPQGKEISVIINNDYDAFYTNYYKRFSEESLADFQSKKFVSDIKKVFRTTERVMKSGSFIMIVIEIDGVETSEGDAQGQ